MNIDEFMPSPLNYTGSKFNLLPQLKKYFPKNHKDYTLVDLFAGGGSVFANSQEFDSIIVNDYIRPLIQFYRYLQTTPWKIVLEEINKRNISKTDQEAYLNLRSQFNVTKNHIDFFLLVCSCTNNMMRFNKKLQFNQTFGKRNFNPSTEKKLKQYHDVIYANYNIQFLSENFIDLEIPENSFVYLDPPYLITEAGYNAYWGKDLEKKLYEYLSDLNSRGIKFMLSNVAEHKGKVNPYLDKLQNYNIIDIPYDYNKVSRAGKSNSKEIIVTNY